MSSQYIAYGTGDGTTVSFAYPFPVISANDLFVTVNGVEEGSWLWGNDQQSIIFQTAPLAGAVVQIVRYTQTIPYVGFEPTAILTENSLTLSETQSLHISAEASDLADAAVLFDPDLNAYDAKRHKIIDVAPAVSGYDVIQLQQVTNTVAAAIADGTIIPPTLGAIATADASAATEWSAAQADGALEATDVAGVNTDVTSVAASLATLYGLVTDPPPDGATIVSLLDAYLGGTTWRTIGDLGAGPVTEWTVTGSHTWTKPMTGTIALIEVWGSGAAGLSASNLNLAAFLPSGAIVITPGGGGGAYNRRYVLLSDLGDTETVTVAAGGVPSYPTSDTGRNGALSSFGTWCKAYGGRSPQTPYTAGAGGGPLGVGTTYRLTYQSLGGAPSWSYQMDIGGNPYAHASGVGGQNTILYQPAIVPEGPGDAAWFPPATNLIYAHNAPQGGYYHGGSGGHVLSPNGAGSVYGGAGGGNGYSLPVDPGATATIGLTIPQGFGATFAQCPYQEPTSFLNGLGGVSQNGGNGGNGGGPSQNGQDGQQPGGGGGGAGIGPNSTRTPNGPLGGAGGNGKVRITIFG